MKLKSILSWLLLLVIMPLTACTAQTTNLPSATQTPYLSQTPTSAKTYKSPTTSHPASSASTATPSNTPTPKATVMRSPTLTPFPSLIIDDFNIPMVLVPAGPFIMGNENWNKNERPIHTVTLDTYYIDQFEVNNTSFAEFLNANGNQIEGYAHWVEASDPDLHIHQVDGIWIPDDGYANHPINEATWYAARAFCTWRNARLPTEAEWEKAARGNDGRTYPWGEEVPTCEIANFSGCLYDSAPIDSYPEGVSPYGVYNMAGNVMEWVADWYISPYNLEDNDNPLGPEQGDYRIFRGGSWFNASTQLRTTYRFAKLPVLTYKANGFRCANDLIP